ncbi:MAG TPA: peptidyl-prolyl cis-trans isomerase [Gammaproteobacteria bacterium]|nr:peptidyl-prolyl cis-trans isomerase [Gammaproteobacteria bacterium]
MSARPAAAAALALALGGVATAPARADDTPLVRLNGEPIRAQDLEAFRGHQHGQGDAGTSRDLPEGVALEQLINRRLLLGAARDRDLAGDPEVKQALEQARRDILIDTLLRRVVAQRVTHQRIESFYEAHFARAERIPQLRVLRRTAPTREAAGRLQRQLSGQASGEGGEWVFADLQPPALAEALAKTKPGTVVGPVASHGGWTVARVTDRRTVDPPALKAVRDAIRSRLEYEAVRTYLAHLRDAAKVEYLRSAEPGAGGGGQDPR